MPLLMRWSSFRSSYQFNLFLIFSLLTFIISALLSTLYIVSEVNESRSYTTEMLRVRTQQFAESIRLPLYAENSDTLRHLAEQLAGLPEIKTVVISTNDGRVLAEVHFPCNPANNSSKNDVISHTADVTSNSLVDSIESALAGHRDSGVTLIGTVRMVQGTANLGQNIRRVIMLSTAIAVVFWLVVVVLCYQVFQRVTNSFNTLVNGINYMQSGDFSSQIIVESDDEPGKAARAVNRLATALQHRSEENALLQEERLNLERQMLHGQKLESLGVMAGGIAHDFNNLLQSILGNMELAMMTITSGSASQKYLDHAMHSAKRAALLAGLMLTYVGKGCHAKKRLNLNELVRENVEMLQVAATSAVSTELHLGSDLPFIMADEANIQQVVMNLITNAGESIQKQPGLITLTTDSQYCDQACLAASLLIEKPEPGRYVILEVRDNGCGMNSETLKRLFDPFFTTKFTGRGLGMSAVMGIMKTHGGALFVDSQPGNGTIFKVLFPASESALPDAMLSKSVPIVPEAGDSSMQAIAGLDAREQGNLPEIQRTGVVLVVDDEKSVLRICTKMVSLCGFTVITACDGLDAIAKFSEHANEIVVVLMDLTMPNMDGIAAMSEIYRISPESKVILSSGFNEDELSERITSQPPAGFIRKPYSMKVLEAELRRVVQCVR